MFTCSPTPVAPPRWAGCPPRGCARCVHSSFRVAGVVVEFAHAKEQHEHQSRHGRRDVQDQRHVVGRVGRRRRRRRAWRRRRRWRVGRRRRRRRRRRRGAGGCGGMGGSGGEAGVGWPRGHRRHVRARRRRRRSLRDGGGDGGRGAAAAWVGRVPAHPRRQEDRQYHGCGAASWRPAFGPFLSLWHLRAAIRARAAHGRRSRSEAGRDRRTLVRQSRFSMSTSRAPPDQRRSARLPRPLGRRERQRRRRGAQARKSGSGQPDFKAAQVRSPLRKKLSATGLSVPDCVLTRSLPVPGRGRPSRP